MGYFGLLTRALTMFCGLQLIMAAFWGFALDGVQAGPVVALILGGFLLTLPVVERAKRQAAVAVERP